MLFLERGQSVVGQQMISVVNSIAQPVATERLAGQSNLRAAVLMVRVMGRTSLPGSLLLSVA